MTQNLVAIEFSPADLEAIDGALAVLEAKLGILITLSADERRTAIKMGDKSEVFCRQTNWCCARTPASCPAISISPDSSRTSKGALHKDQVTVAVTESRSRRRPEGRIVSIEKRALARVIGHIKYFDKFAVVFPENTKIFPEVMVHHDQTLGSKDDDRVVVEITEWGKGQNKSIWGKVISILENLTDHEMNMQSILLLNGFDPEFSEEVLSEAASLHGDITDDEIAGRRDFRQGFTSTIDPLTAKDFDDALSYRILDNGNIEVGIHIADVTHYLKEDTALDKDAFRRSTSVHLVDRVCPMLPKS